jgi:hypothetical protein
MHTKIIISRNKDEHEININKLFASLSEIDKLLIFHKIVRVGDAGFTFITYVHFTEK